MEAINDAIEPIILAFQVLIEAIVVIKSIMILQKTHGEVISVKDALQKVKKNIKTGIIGAFLPEIISLLFDTIFFRSGDNVTWETSNAIEGSIILIHSFSKVLLILEVPLLVFVTILKIKNYMVCPEDEKGQHKKNTITTVGIGLLIVSITGIFTFVMNIYGKGNLL